MKRLSLALLLFVPLPASAGFGTSGRIGSSYFPVTADVHTDKLLVQIHAMDLLIGLFDGGSVEVDTGAELTAGVWKKPVGGDVDGVIMPGGGLHVLVADGYFGWELFGSARFGAQMQEGAGFGVYVVPQAGFANQNHLGTGDVGFLARGQIEISWWMK